MKKGLFSALLAFIFSFSILAAGTGSGVRADAALKMLLAGNERFVAGDMLYPNQNPARRIATENGQKPFAVIITCSDSRVPPELIFDRGIGDIFVVRAAGNLIDDYGMGSVEYAVEHLGAKLVMVLGHSKCGAIKAALDSPDAPGKIGKITKDLQPAVKYGRELPGDPLENAINANVLMIVKQLKESKPIMTEMIKEKGVKVVGGVYDIKTGKVSIISK